MTKYVYDFTEGNKDQKDLLGGKGANLAEMTNLGLPVPPGSRSPPRPAAPTSSDGRRARRARRRGRPSTSRALEEAMGRTPRRPDDPLLVSVRSGAKFSMPGMMETVLNVGLNDESVQGLAEQAGDERFAWDSYRRLIQMFGKHRARHRRRAVRRRARRGSRTSRGADERPRPRRRRPAASWSRRSRRSSREHTGRDVPAGPARAAGPRRSAPSSTRGTPTARVLYRRQERIPDDLGTAVNVCAMVFGNLGTDSGTGVAFTRDPATGAQGVYGDYLQNAQGEDVVAGIRNTVPLADLGEHRQGVATTSCSRSWRRSSATTATCATSSSPSSAASSGCCRPGSASAPPAAAFRIAVQLVDEGLIDLDEALRRVTGAQLAQLMFPRFDDERRARRCSPRA